MSDLAAPILYVMRDEAEAFWCFACLMERMQVRPLIFPGAKSHPPDGMHWTPGRRQTARLVTKGPQALDLRLSTASLEACIASVVWMQLAGHVLVQSTVATGCIAGVYAVVVSGEEGLSVGVCMRAGQLQHGLPGMQAQLSGLGGLIRILDPQLSSYLVRDTPATGHNRVCPGIHVWPGPCRQPGSCSL